VTVRLHRQRGGAERALRFAVSRIWHRLRKRHHAGRGRLRDAVDLERLGAAPDVVGAVLAQDHRTDVQPGARLQRIGRPASARWYSPA
jgi:hypothetical protein